ncbi:MAG: NAD(P)/FAD-dependent oxidoreductase [Clostridiales bacterium]|nr:NAD(P)/FAD-dependent oxidoreductase [Clostridiales bacterium]
MSKWDAIVVGAGNGGLLAAVTLAKAGKKTLLLERHNLPGGFATSFKRGRFEFEASLHELCGFGKSDGMGSIRKMFDELDLTDKIEWVDIPAAYRLITLNDEKNIDATMPFGRDAYIDAMEKYVPGSRKSVTAFFDLADDINATTAFFADIETLKPSVISIIKEAKKEHMNFLRTAGYPFDTVMAKLHVPQSARNIINAYWDYLGIPCDEIGFIHYSSMVRDYITTGAVAPKSRSHEISTAVVDEFEKAGGVVWFNSPVEQILMENGRVKGVKIAGGKVEQADHIICNTSPHNVFGKLMDPKDVPEYEIKKANSREFAARGFTMFLGLNKSPEELGITDHCYLIYDTMDTRKQYELMKNIETNNVQASVCLNLADKDASPEGTSILYITTLFTADAWKDVTPENYVKTKQYMANKMIDNFEKAAGVKIRDAIEEIEIATPMTYARYTDAPQGVIYGYDAGRYDGVVARTVMLNADEKIPGLRFAGGYGTQHDGYSSAYTSGHNAALETLKDMKKEVEAK